MIGQTRLPVLIPLSALDALERRIDFFCGATPRGLFR